MREIIKNTQLHLLKIQELINNLQQNELFPKNYFQPLLDVIIINHSRITFENNNTNSGLAVFKQISSIHETTYKSIKEYLQTAATQYGIAGNYVSEPEPNIDLLSQAVTLIEQFSVAMEQHSNGKSSSENSKSKRKTRNAIFEAQKDTDLPNQNEKINLLARQLETLVLTNPSYNLNIERHIENDFILHPLLKSLQEKNEIALKIHSEMKKKISTYSDQTGYHSIIIKQLESTLLIIEQINEEKKSLQTAITSRMNLIAPQTNTTEELITHFVNSQSLFLGTLESFLKNFSTLHLAKRTDAESIFFRAQLVQFIEQLNKELKEKKLPIDFKIADNLREHCLKHLGEKVSFFNIITTVVELEESTINRCTKELSSSKISDDPNTLKKQIADFYHVAAKIREFPITTMIDYCASIAELEKIALEIDTKHKLAQDEITSDLLKKLQHHLSLFLLVTPESLVVKDANDVKLKLHHLANNLDQFKEHYDQIKTTNRTNLDDKLTQSRLNKQDTNMRYSSIQSTLVSAHTMVVEENKQFDIFNQFIEQLNQFRRWTLQCIHALSNEYNNQKTQLIQIMENAVANAEAALTIQYTDPTTLQQKIKEQIAPHTELIEQLKTREDGLNTLQWKKNESIQKLDLVVTEAKKYLRLQYAKAHSEINQQHVSQVNVVALSKENPFKEDLESITANTNEAITQMNTHFSSLDNLQGKELGKWSSQFEKNYHSVDKIITTRDKIRQQAKIIQNRLDSEAYATAIDIAQTLYLEFFRLLTEYIGKAVVKYPSDQEIAKIQQDILSGKLDINAGWTKPTLDKIEPRLTLLLSMYQDFYQINNSYISKNLSLYTDKTFIDGLIKKVETHLHNDHMESLSDGHRPLFIQWIRIHILKSLQSVSQRFIDYIKHHQSGQHRFFSYRPVTPGACVTEKALVEKGNEVQNVLQPLAAAAA